MKFISISMALLLSINTFSQKKWDLQDCLSYAYKNNLQIKEASLAQQIQAKEVKFQKNKRLPTLSARINNGFSYGFQQVFSGEFVGQYKEIQSYRNDGSVNASIVLWNKNAQKIRIENEEINLINSLLAAQQKKFELQMEIIAKYYSVLIAKERLELAKQVFENREKQKENKEELYQLGNIARNLLSQEKANWIQDWQAYQTEKINLKKALFELAILLQLPNKESFDVADVSEESFALEKSIEEVVHLALSNRASIQIAKEKVKFSKNEIGNYKTQYYPKITLDYSLGSSAQQVFENENIAFKEQFRNNFYQYVSIGIQIPLFNQGNTKIKIQQAKIKTTLRELQLEQEKQNLKNNIETLYIDMLAAKENYQAAKEAEKQTKEVSLFSEKSYEIGAITAFEYTRMRNEYVLSQLKKIQIKYELLFKQQLLESYTLKMKK